MVKCFHKYFYEWHESLLPNRPGTREADEIFKKLYKLKLKGGALAAFAAQRSWPC